MRFGLEDMKAGFFDREKVDKALDAPTKKAFSKYGVYTQRSSKRSLKRAKRSKLADLPTERQRAFRIRKSIAKRKGEAKPTLPDAVSKPGQPPLLHARTHGKKKGKGGNSPLRELIYYAYDPASRSVVIGPVAFNASRGRTTKALEHGGTTKINTLVRSRKKTRKRGHRIKTFTRTRKRVTARIEARPFMAPAGKKHLSILTELKSSIT